MQSLWSDSCSFRRRDSLNSDINAEAVVIGAGMAGLLTAYMLKSKGVEPIVIDARSIAGGVTKNTTAKITSQHYLIYDKLIKNFGKSKAYEYAMANELAIRQYEEIVNKENIDCDFEKVPAYIYSLNEEDKSKLESELKAAKELGIDAELTDGLNIPLDIKCALKYNNQGQFNPLRFLQAISDRITIYENTRALDVRENLVITEKGKITAKHIVVATHYPIINVPGYYFTRMHQSRSYVLVLENAQKVDGMSIDMAQGGYSFRNYKDLLIFGGASHRTGENEQGGKYEALRKAALELYPNSIEKYHWSAQDCVPLDEVPYIGKYSAQTENMYVATGFNKWGMSSSMVSAMIISDMIVNRENKFSAVFSPQRFNVSASAKNLIKDSVKITKNFIAEKLEIPKADIEKIKRGHGGIVSIKGAQAGVYKDEEGRTFIVSTKCPHLGCQLQWNPDELTWDCPCHGSRFDYHGKWLEGPSIKNIE